MRRVLSLAGAFLVAGVTIAGAAEPGLEVHLDPRKIGIEDATVLVVRILEPEGTPEVDLGALENLEIVSGPSTKTELSWINGVAARAVSYSYVVQGLEVGAAAIGPVTVRLDGTELSSEIVRAEIVPGSILPRQQPGRRSPFLFDPFEDLAQRHQPTRSARIVLRQLVGESRVVLGQALRVAIVLDTTAGGVDGFEWTTPPSYPGWWAQRIEPPERVTGEVVEVEGVRYNRFVVASHVLVPLKTGRLEVPLVEARIGFRSASLFSPQQVVERATEARIVEVSERPRPPEGFSGAVGDLRYRAKIEPETIDFGDSAVLTIELRGNGNLPLVEAPAKWPECLDCESYPPEEESKVAVDESGIHGSRVWRTTLVPRTSGEIDLGPVMLAVFDPVAGHYRKQTLGPLRLVVEPPPVTPTPVVESEERVVDLQEMDDTVPSTGGDEAGVPLWAWIVGALILGLTLGGVAPLMMARKRKGALPPRRAGESPAERARELQVALERWWMDARARAKGRALEGEMQQLRRELEAIRFAPGRADHTETVHDLEERLRGLMRRA
ncbi:MAG: BatD family protein [Thermoanaerobaculales bacterium]|nr:BatD family protein [Thermoanaerobaculales bacterium]